MNNNPPKKPPRSEVTIKDNETLALCRCWQSKKFPYCDGSHRQLENESIGPVIVRINNEIL